MLLQCALEGSSARAAQLGSDPSPDVQVVAEQSEALCVWYKAGIRGRPLVHISARLNIASTDIEVTPDLALLRAELAHGSCESLRPRTGSNVREDALWHTDAFLLPAFLLGVVREVWWVVPARQDLPEKESDAFREWLRGTYGLPEEFLTSLRFGGKQVLGSYRGLPIHIVTLADLPPFTESVLVGIDAEYLMRLFDNPVRESMLDLVGGVLNRLSGKGLQTEKPIVSSSYLSGRVTVGYAYIASWVKDCLAEPARYAKSPREEWRTQAHFEYLTQLLARDKAFEVARGYAEAAPASPIPWYDQAQIAFIRRDAPKVRQFLEEAVRRDATYRAGYNSLAQAFASLDMPDEAQVLLEAGTAAFPDDVSLGLALGILYLKRGLFNEAARFTGGLAGRQPRYPAVHAQHAFALRSAGRAAEAEEAIAIFRRTAPPGKMRSEVLAAWESSTGEDPVPAAVAPGSVSSPSP